MKIVYKYELHLGNNSIKLPVYSEVLTAQYQENRIVIWVLADQANLNFTNTRYFNVVMTGGAFAHINADLVYINTIQKDGMVYHIFEDKFNG